MKKLILILSFLLVTAWQPALGADVPTMTKEELNSQLSSANLVILDVRSGRDWSSSEFKIQGAIRAPGSELATWAKNYQKDQALVLYCA